MVTTSTDKGLVIVGMIVTGWGFRLYDGSGSLLVVARGEECLSREEQDESGQSMYVGRLGHLERKECSSV